MNLDILVSLSFEQKFFWWICNFLPMTNINKSVHLNSSIALRFKALFRNEKRRNLTVVGTFGRFALSFGRFIAGSVNFSGNVFFRNRSFTKLWKNWYSVCKLDRFLTRFSSVMRINFFDDTGNFEVQAMREYDITHRNLNIRKWKTTTDRMCNCEFDIRADLVRII